MGVEEGRQGGPVMRKEGKQRIHELLRAVIDPFPLLARHRRCESFARRKQIVENLRTVPHFRKFRVVGHRIISEVGCHIFDRLYQVFDRRRRCRRNK